MSWQISGGGKKREEGSPLTALTPQDSIQPISVSPEVPGSARSFRCSRARTAHKRVERVEWVTHEPGLLRIESCRTVDRQQQGRREVPRNGRRKEGIGMRECEGISRCGKVDGGEGGGGRVRRVSGP